MPTNYTQFQDMDVIENYKYTVDIVFCIDATGSMSPIMDNMKDEARTLYRKFIEKMERESKQVDQCRVKVIAFRDFGYSDAPAMTQEGFFTLPEQDADFEAALKRIRPTGGGDDKENAWEAVATAIQSDWTTKGSKHRQVVVLMTDEEALDLSTRASCAGYPKNMPKTLAELKDWWNGHVKIGNYEKEAGRLIVFAPNKGHWCTMTGWDRCWTDLSTASGKGLKDKNLEIILNVLVKSI